MNPFLLDAALFFAESITAIGDECIQGKKVSKALIYDDILLLLMRFIFYDTTRNGNRQNRQ